MKKAIAFILSACTLLFGCGVEGVGGKNQPEYNEVIQFLNGIQDGSVAYESKQPLENIEVMLGNRMFMLPWNNMLGVFSNEASKLSTDSRFEKDGVTYDICESSVDCWVDMKGEHYENPEIICEYDMLKYESIHVSRNNARKNISTSEAREMNSKIGVPFTIAGIGDNSTVKDVIDTLGKPTVIDIDEDMKRDKEYGGFTETRIIMGWYHYGDIQYNLTIEFTATKEKCGYTEPLLDYIVVKLT